jgi:hypothetical protein
MDDDTIPLHRFRIVIELTLPDADPMDASVFELLHPKILQALSSLPDLPTSNVVIREAQNIGPTDRYEDWRGGPKYDFSSFSAGISYLFGGSFPLAPVDPADLARVWGVLEKAEAGEFRNRNIAIAIGQAMQPDSNAEATIARACALRMLHARKAIPGLPSISIFEKAAAIPIEKSFRSESELDSLAQHFND